MKKLAKATLVCFATCMALFFYSCDEKTTNEVDAKYADLTVEQNKENLQNEGMAVMEKMNAMKDMEWTASVQSLATLLDMDGQDEVYYPINALLAPLAKADKHIMAIAGLRASSVDFNSLSTLFQQRGGIYTYNAAVDTFAIVPSTTEITFRFPIGESTTNNGTLTINNYTYKTATNEDFVGEEMPKTLNISIKNGNTTLMSVVLNASYNSDDLPSAESTVITFKEGYSFSQAASYDPSKVSWDFSLAYNNATFFQGGFDMDGTLAYDSLSTVDSEEDFMDRLLNSVNASIQLGNIKAVGQVTYAQMMKEMKSFQEKNGREPMAEPTWEQLIDEQCAILNKNIKASLIYADTKQAIAKLSFYRSSYQYGNQSYPEMATKAVFEDGTAMDDSFFNEGFTELQTAWETFVADMMESYGIDQEEEYDDEYPYQPY